MDTPEEGFYQEAMVVNYPSPDVPFTRIVEYKHVPNQVNQCSHPLLATSRRPLGLAQLHEPCYARVELSGKVERIPSSGTQPRAVVCSVALAVALDGRGGNLRWVPHELPSRAA